MKEAKNLKEKVFFIATGVRLHTKLYTFKVLGKLNRYKYCIAFPSIKEGLEAEKAVKKSGLKTSSIPIPDEIFRDCGVGIITDENNIKETVKLLKKKNISISGIYLKNGKTFEEITL